MMILSQKLCKQVVIAVLETNIINHDKTKPARYHETREKIAES